MLCRYDVFIFGGVDEEWKHFLGPCCKVDDEIKTASDVACTLYLFAAKLNSLGKRCFSSTARTLLRFAVVAVTTTSTLGGTLQVCCLHCYDGQHRQKSSIMGTFENGLHRVLLLFYLSPRSQEHFTSPCSYAGRDTWNQNLSLSLNFERKRLELVSAYTIHLNVPTFLCLFLLMFYGRSWRVFCSIHGR
jgi:hypothetical protein